LFRRGHLSEKALLSALTSGERPAHLDRCDLCAQRATELGDWLDAVRTTGIEAADAVFADEQLKVQRAHIMNRLEQADEPSRVIEFPRHAPVPDQAPRSHRVAPIWIGVAAAAGIALGVVGGQLTARLGFDGTQTAMPTTATAVPTDADAQATPILDNIDAFSTQFDEYTPESLSAMDEMMPVLQAAMNSGG
jgi:hypothetical protein